MKINPVARFKVVFFSRAKLIKALGGYQWAVLSHFGALVRKIARRSMRKGRYVKRTIKGKQVTLPKPSPPGTPPRVWEGTLKKLVLYRVRPKERDVIIGSERDFRKRKVGAFVIPQLHEYGGIAPVRVIKNGRRTNIIRNAKYPDRSYMRPALKKALLMLPMIMKRATRFYK